MTTAVVTTEVPQEQAAPRPAQGSRRRPPRVNRPVGGAGAGVLLWGYAALALVPLLLMVSNSFRTNADLITDPLGLPTPPTTASYVEAWTTGNFATYFGNSLAVTVGAVAISTSVATMAAYALARGRSRIFRWLESLFLSGLMLPIHLAILPIFYLFDGLGLIDSRLGLTLMYASSGIPFSIFVLTTFFRQLPEELEEAAALDGASPWQTFWRVMVPLAKPGIIALAVFTTLWSWNDLIWPLIVTSDQDKMTLSVGLAVLAGGLHHINYPVLMAGALLATLPMLLTFIILQRQFIQGIAFSGTKG